MCHVPLQNTSDTCICFVLRIFLLQNPGGCCLPNTNSLHFSFSEHFTVFFALGPAGSESRQGCHTSPNDVTCRGRRSAGAPRRQVSSAPRTTCPALPPSVDRKCVAGTAMWSCPMATWRESLGLKVGSYGEEFGFWCWFQSANACT